VTHWFGCLQSDLHGMIPVVGGQFLSLQSDAIRWPSGLKQAAAVCNSLTLISKSKVVGELGERRAFNAVEARFVVRIFCAFCVPCCVLPEHQFCPAMHILCILCALLSVCVCGCVCLSVCVCVCTQAGETQKYTSSSNN